MPETDQQPQIVAEKAKVAVKDGAAPITCETCTREEANIFWEWARKEGWRPGTNDADTFFAQDNGGFFCAKLEETGEIVAIVSVVRYEPDFAFVGFYICKPEHRGKGYGYKLWKHSMDANYGERNVGLDGTWPQVSDYEKCGFKTFYAHARYVGNAEHRPNFSPSYEMKIEKISKDTPKLIDAAAKYDADNFFEADRTQFMKNWVVQEGMISLIATHEVTGAVKGLVCARPDDQGYGIGPLYAADAVTAKDLLFAIQNELPKDESFLVDVPDKNVAGVDLLKNDLGMSFVFDCARMYTKGPPAKPDVNCVFGNCTLMLG